MTNRMILSIPQHNVINVSCFHGRLHSIRDLRNVHGIDMSCLHIRSLTTRLFICMCCFEFTENPDLLSGDKLGIFSVGCRITCPNNPFTGKLLFSAFQF